MFSSELKQQISEYIQQLLPEGEINFLLHVDGAESWSWANIKNNSAVDHYVPQELIKNMCERR